MRKVLTALTLCSFLAFGMGEPTGTPPEVKGLTVVVIDKNGVKHRLKNPTCEGLSYLKVRKGSLEYSVSLTRIKKIEVLKVEKDRVLLKIYTKDGKEEVFEASPNTFCVMQSELGNVSFSIKDVKEIIVEGEER